jgi:outer membrane protein OmpA-like peptidoglycan-associated protein
MRVASFLIVALCCLASRVEAQVSVDMHALDQLTPGQPTPAPAPPARIMPRQPATSTQSATPDRPITAQGDQARTATAVPRARPTSASRPVRTARTPTVPAATAHPVPVEPATPATPTASATPSIPALPGQQPAEPPASTTKPAPTPSALPLPPPVRVTFEEGKADLSPQDEAAIMVLAHEIPSTTSSSINVIAYAAGKPDDPSTARRLSLSRGMAVRSVLLSSGVPSAQIYVRALGATASDGPADRVELVVAPLGTVTR